MSTVWWRIVNREALCCVSPSSPRMIIAYCGSSGMWVVSGHVGLQICPFSVLQSPSIHSVYRYSSAARRKWGYIQRIKPTQRQRVEKKRSWHIVVSSLWWAALKFPWTLEDLALILLCAGSHLSVTSWPPLTNSCLVIKAQWIPADSPNPYQASLDPRVHGIVWESAEQLHCEAAALSLLKQAQKGIHPSAPPSVP